MALKKVIEQNMVLASKPDPIHFSRDQEFVKTADIQRYILNLEKWAQKVELAVRRLEEAVIEMQAQFPD